MKPRNFPLRKRRRQARALRRTIKKLGEQTAKALGIKLTYENFVLATMGHNSFVDVNFRIGRKCRLANGWPKDYL